MSDRLGRDDPSDELGIRPRRSPAMAVARLALAQGFGQTAFHAFVATLPLAMVAVGRPDGEIGIAVGSASIFYMLASLAVGGLIDRYGSGRLFMAGIALLSGGALLFALGVVRADSPLPLILIVRCIQGLGVAAIIPASLSIVPSLVSVARLPTALAAVGVAANVSLAIVPPVTLLILDQYGLAAVGLAAAITSAAGAVLLLTGVPGVMAAPAIQGSGWIRLGWRREWLGPLLSCALFIVHWGVVTAYLPQRAEAAGADVGLFFTGDAIALLAARIPGGMLVGKLGSLRLMVAGLIATSIAVGLLLLPLSTPLLILSGAGVGFGAALVLPAILIELSQRSDDADRGSAFGLYGVAFGVGLATGSVGAAPLIGVLGFHGLLITGIALCLAAAAVSIRDARTWGRRKPPPSGPSSDGGVDEEDLEAQAIAESETEFAGA